MPERDRQWEKVSFTGIIERAVGLVAGQARTLKAAPEHRILSQSAARRKDIVLAGGVCGIPDEQVRHRQRRKDTAAKTTRAKGQHTDSGVWRRDPVFALQTSERRKVGAAVPPRSVCWRAELTVRGSGCHRAGTGDQDKVGKHQESARSRREGTLAERSRCEPLLGPQMAVTKRSTSKLAWRDPLRWCPETQERC